ncbi:MAG TPA: ABC transporter substrate-binding protein, partial [Anaerolineae bacterium]|nr:ABC transporter substrate-binding protein [Anaerolineae bacterium]
MNKRIWRFGSAFALAAIAVAIVLAACAAPTTQPPAPAPTVAQPTAALAQPTTAPAQPTMAPAQPTAAPEQPTAAPTQAPSASGTDRAKTLILDTEGGKVADAKNFNPYAGGRGGSNGVVQALTEPVFTTNLVTGKIEPWLADSMTPNEDFTRWTLKLKKGIEWSDGQPLTADDVLFTVAMIQKFPDLALPYKFKDVTAKKIDDQTVEFTLPQSDPRWQLTVWSSNLQSQEVKLVPEHIWKDVADPVKFTNYDPEKGYPVFSGAWTLDKVVSDVEFTYKLNPNWWGAKTGFRPLPQVQNIVYTILGDENTNAAALDKGDLDSLAPTSPNTFLTLQAKNPKIIAWSKNPPYGNPDVCDRNLEFNTTVQPWDDPEMRWAVAQAIDRSKIIDIAYGGFASPSYNFLPDFRGLDHYRDLLDK